jgi:hypothetical protein
MEEEKRKRKNPTRQREEKCAISAPVFSLHFLPRETILVGGSGAGDETVDPLA